MSESLRLLDIWMGAPEDEHLEFKEAKNRFDFEKLVCYCVALANEGGGKMILGVTDKRPRRVVGSQAFPNLVQARSGVSERIGVRLGSEELNHANGRVVVFHIPTHPIGIPLHYKGTYWMREGEELVPMKADRLKSIFAEVVLDYSAEFCTGSSLSNLDTDAIERFRVLWIEKSKNQLLASLSHSQLLTDAELLVDDQVTYAPLILFGNRQALNKHLGQSEVIFEYRSSDASGPAAQREEFRQGVLLTLDTLWNTINLRNDRQPYQYRLAMVDVPTFNERACREVVLNSVVHRDYQREGSVFVRQYPRRLEVVSPGGFLPGISIDNVLWSQSPRNRRLSEAISRCGLVERSGQGMNRIYEACIRESKPEPDFTHTDSAQVWVTLRGEIQDERFLQFLASIGNERLERFTTEEYLALDAVRRGLPMPSRSQSYAPALAAEGILTDIGEGQYALSKLYTALSSTALSIKQQDERQQNKDLLLQYIREHNDRGSKLDDLRQVTLHLNRDQVQYLLQELKTAGNAHNEGRTSASRWFAGPA